jgi:class 3 adenylate cyclase/tetratricopeptide (TPR) repeat protein
MRSITDWLAEVGLSQYAEVFVRNEIGFDVLPDLTEVDLEQLGIPLGSRKRLMKAIGALGAEQAPTARPAAPSAYTPRHLVEKILTSRAALEGERKQVTVLFCDIANSTGHAERLGEERMHALLNRFFELALEQVHRYEGTINQFLGDGFMALFGAPVAHEDHARRAVLAALDLQQALAQAGEDLGALELRMGLNTGPVVVGKIGDNLRMDYTAVGDTTNLAARLQQNARPGAILVSETTERLVHGYIRAQPLPPLRVKGKSEPIAGFEVLGRGSRRSYLDASDERALSRFVGRHRELSTLTAVLAEVEGGHGQVVGIVGEAGVGKSRLLYEFRKSLAERGIDYLEGRCLSFGTAIPYLPVLDVLRAACGVTELDTHDEVARKVATRLEGVAEEREDLAFLLLLLGMREGASDVLALSPESIKAGTFRALRRICLGASRRRPVVVAVEDLHWIDRTSDEFLASLVESVPGAALLLLGTYRHGYRPPWMDQSYASQIGLRPLSAEDSRIVVASSLAQGSLTDELAQSIVRKGEGNPFFLEELSHNAVADGAQRARRELPDTIQGVLLARIDRLDEQSKQLLQTAAVLGREAPLRLLRETCDAPLLLDAGLHALKRDEFLYERGDGREAMFVFKHVLTQEAAYEGLLESHRAVLHEAAGRALERLYAGRLDERYDLLAYHYSRSANADKAVEYLVHANRKAMAADAPVEAQAYFARALSLLESQPDSEATRRRRIGLLAEQIVVFQNLFRMQEYYDLLTRYEPIALELDDPALLGPLVQQIGHCDWTFGRFEQAERRFQAAARMLEAAGNYAVAAQTYQISMWNYNCMGEFEKALQLRERAERAWEKGPNLRWYVYALSAAALAYGYLGRFDEGLREAHKAVAVAERFRDATQGSFAAWALGFVYLCQGDLERALEYAKLGVDKAPTPAEKAWAQGVLAGVWCRAGEFDKAIEALAPLYRALRGGGFVPGERWALFLGEAYWRAGRYPEARAAITEGLAIHRRHGMKYEAAVSLRLLAEVEACEGDAALAEQHYRESMHALENLGAQGDLALACAGYGRFCGRQGRVARARQQLGRALEIAKRIGVVGVADALAAEIAALG